MVWFGLVWFGLVWYGTVWYCLVFFVWYGLDGLVWFGRAKHGFFSTSPGCMLDHIENKANSVKIQLNLPAGTELGNKF